MELIKRGRRLRGSSIIRGLTRETRISTKSLIYPLFIQEGQGIMAPIPTLENQYYYSSDTVGKIIDESLKVGVSSFMLFGIPKEKDSLGTFAYREDGVVQKALRAIKEAYGDSVNIITDVVYVVIWSMVIVVF